MIGIIFWVAAIYALWSRGPAIYYLYFISWSFGTLAVVPPSLGSINITPAWACAALLALKIFMEVGAARFMQVLFHPQRFLALTMCTLWGIVSAIVCSNLFAGKVNIAPIRVLHLFALEPVSFSITNITQSFYFLLTSLATVSIFFAARSPDRRLQILNAFLVGAITAAATGMLDLVAKTVGLSALLDPFRNATYATMAESTFAGVNRLAGLMPEASGYAGLCIAFLPLLAFTTARPGEPRSEGNMRLAVAALLFVMTCLSTSSGGLATLALIGAMFAFLVMIDALRGSPSALISTYVGLIGLAGVVGVFAFFPEVAQGTLGFIDSVIFKKYLSESYVERSLWNSTALNAFVQSYGLGVGLGSARASSWQIAVLANLGVFGAATLIIFFGQIFLGNAVHRQDIALLRATKLALIPNLAVAALGGTSPNFGLNVATLAGLAAALCFGHPVRASTWVQPADDDSLPIRA